MENDKKLVEVAINNVMQPTDQESSKKFSSEVKGYDLNEGVNYDKILSTFIHTGFQATNLGRAINEVNRMVYLNIQ